MPPRSRKRGDNPTPYERYIRDPETKEVKGISRPIARSRTMPLESTKPKDAPRTPNDVARDLNPGRPLPLRPRECCTTIPEFRGIGDRIESRNPAPVYNTMQSKGYDKSEGRATHRGGRTDITSEGSDVDDTTADGSDVDESADDASAAGSEAAGHGSTAGSDPTITEAAGTAEVMLERVLMMQVLLEERLSVMETRLERRLLVMEALLEEYVQERWRLRPGSLRERYSGGDEEGDEETLWSGSETDY